jgi:hypothetical protein
MNIFVASSDKVRREITTFQRKLGLDKISSDDSYLLRKINGATIEIVIDRGFPYLVGNDEGIWLVVFDRYGNWFKTSPIKSFNQKKKIITTQNSRYQLCSL